MLLLPRVIFGKYWVAFFTVNFAHLHYNKIYHVYEAVAGYFVVLATKLSRVHVTHVGSGEGVLLLFF